MSKIHVGHLPLIAAEDAVQTLFGPRKGGQGLASVNLLAYGTAALPRSAEEIMMIPVAPNASLCPAPGSAAEHRLRVQQAAEDRAALRTSELAEQTSSAKAASERIQIWERLHALRLPQAAGHVLVRVIATQTCLTVGQIHAEQQRRRAAMPALSEGSAVSQSNPEQAAASSTSQGPG